MTKFWVAHVKPSFGLQWATTLPPKLPMSLGAEWRDLRSLACYRAWLMNVNRDQFALQGNSTFERDGQQRLEWP